jgi:hypothetical protein
LNKIKLGFKLGTRYFDESQNYQYETLEQGKNLKVNNKNMRRHNI